MVLVILVPSLAVSVGLVLLSVALMRYLRYLKRSHDAIHLTVRALVASWRKRAARAERARACGIQGPRPSPWERRAAPQLQRAQRAPRRRRRRTTRPAPRRAAQEAWKRRNPPGLISDGNDRVLREVTVVITDVEGSTELWEWDHGVMTVALEIHDNIMRDLISRRAPGGSGGGGRGRRQGPGWGWGRLRGRGAGARGGGSRGATQCAAAGARDAACARPRPRARRYCGFEVTTEGDSFTVAFHDAFDAVSWALAMQQVRRLSGRPRARAHACASLQRRSPSGSMRGLLLAQGPRVCVCRALTQPRPTLFPHPDPPPTPFARV